MKKIRFLITALPLLFALGCATLPISYNEPTPERIKAPELNKEVEAEIGNPLILYMFKKTHKAVVLLNPETRELSYRINYTQVNLPAVKYKFIGSNGIYDYFEPPCKLSFTYSSGTLTEEYGGIGIPKTEGLKMKVFFVKPDWTDEIDPVSYKETSITEIPKDGYKHELIYNGIDGKTIKCIYREYLNDLARPAFTQELSYNLDVDTTIGFKGSRIKILDANNTSVKYIVLKHIDENVLPGEKK